MTKGGVTYYYHTNGHGDVTELTDGNGNVVAQYQYDAWGNIISQSGTMASSNPYRYTGYRYDNETGLYYLMARYYDPSVGRFITRDTFGGTSDNPLSLNQYSYTNNNPVMGIDPTGHNPYFAAALRWWGLKLWFSHTFVQKFASTKGSVIYGIATASLYMLVTGVLYAYGIPIPPFVASAYGALVLAERWTFINADKGGGTVIQVSWIYGTHIVPSYVG